MATYDCSSTHHGNTAINGEVDNVSMALSFDDSQGHLLLKALHRYLPFCLPIYRRLQFHLSHPNPRFAQIFESSAGRDLPSSTYTIDVPTSLHQAGENGPQPWLCAHIDLSAAGETQVWVFANWEVSHHDVSQAESSVIQTRRQLLQALFEAIYNNAVPQLSESPPESWLRVKKRKALPFSRSRVLIGALHSSVLGLIPDEAIERVDFPYLKYIFPKESYANTGVPSTHSASITLPEGYQFGALQPDHLSLVLERTHIPRTTSTLATMFSIGLFYQETPAPIGWAFLGKDASLTSLHTEPEHRGQGLAVLLSRELFRRQTEHFKSSKEDDTARDVEWAHADVSESNVGSRKVMEKIGGEARWEVGWVEVELERLVGKKGIWRGRL